MNKKLIVTAIVLIIFTHLNIVNAERDIHDYTGESVQYLISPLGRSEYNNLGVVDLDGRKVNLLTIRSKVLMFGITEKIYSDPESLLPYKIERTVTKLLRKEFVTEEYDQKKFTVVIKKFKGKKLVQEKMIQADCPIQNVILFLFYLRKYPDLKIGWSFTANIPAELKSELVPLTLELVSIDEITIPAGKFKSYHFKTIPYKFEFWLNQDSPRIPLKLRTKGFIDCAVVMKNYTPGKLSGDVPQGATLAFQGDT